MIITKEEEEKFKNEKFCHICNKKYDKIIKQNIEIMIILQVSIWVVPIQNVINNFNIRED